MMELIAATPLGNIQLSLADNHLLGLSFTHRPLPPAGQGNDVANTILEALKRYFDDGQYVFELPLSIKGTPFQQRVWKALQQIPAGTTLTYGQLAKQLNTSPRAIGNACRRNPIPIIIPCHRIVGQKGLTGYAGHTQGESLNTKRFLLEHERVDLQS